MRSRIFLVVVATCLFVIAAYTVGYKAGYKAGENSTESKLREKELAFQKEKEAARKAEFVKLLKIYEEEKRAAEEYKRQQRLDKLNADLMNMLNESEKRKSETLMKLMESLSQMGRRY